jgi:electron transport complex protein RnfB
MAGFDDNPTRRDVLATIVRGAGLAVGGSVIGFAASSGRATPLVWQIDPYKCTWCGKCATDCVLNPSAVKCLNYYPICGYCNLCTGYFEADPHSLSTAAENQLCPTNALVRRWVEGDYYQYDIDADRCTGCAKCVEGCTVFGNGSLFLQIDRKLCVDCNECSIARVCPAEAISRVPLEEPYQIKTKMREG